MAGLSWGEGIQSREEQRERKRMTILRTAAQTINEVGFRQMSLDKLATKLNVTKPTLYYYVKNKDDILSSILEVAMTQLRQEIQTVSETNLSGLGKLHHFMQRYAVVMGDDFGACLITSRISAFASGFKEQYHEASREVLTAVRTLISEGIQDGSIAECDPKYVSSALLGTMNETVYWNFIGGKEKPELAFIQFWKFFEKGLRTNVI
ncbi:MAG: TetR/AcrR family transcriptional regulator [Chloroflexota bacterium]